MSRGWSYLPGDWWILCDSCNKKIRASESRLRWDGFIVCKDDYETRHPQDFLQARQDKISVPFSRPRAEDQFVTIDLSAYPTDTLAVTNESFTKTVTIVPLNFPITTGSTSNEALGFLTLGSIVLGGSGSGQGFSETIQISENRPTLTTGKVIAESQAIAESVTIYHVVDRSIGTYALGTYTLG